MNVLTPRQRDLVNKRLEVNKWALWCTLYTDASNAGGDPLTPRVWAWGARGRIDYAIAQYCEVPVYLGQAGPMPEAGHENSQVAEMWAIVHGVAHVLQTWPFLQGIGIRSDNDAAAAGVQDCDGRGRLVLRGGKHRAFDAARKALADLLQTAGVLARGTHVRGHNRADDGKQRAFNRDADDLARRLATQLNGDLARSVEARK